MSGASTEISGRLDGTHAGMLLTSSQPDFGLEASAQDFDDTFGATLDDAKNPKAFTTALFDAKVIAGAAYADAILGPPEQDHDTQPQLGKFWSAFADWCIDRTLRFVWQMPSISRFLVKAPEPGSIMPGLIVLGLGKLGGRDLNYSSDVDLVAFFETELLEVGPGAGRTDVAIRALKALTQILSGTHGPRIWRVDWRLRPDPSVTGLTMSAEAGLDFFFFHAAPWRRLAMMKARPVAGDINTGNRFLNELTPFLWRKTLDFRAIEEISAIKNRIRDEHPDLDDERSSDTPLSQVDGFHTKLGSGGIREIEFVINALQLVWGGRQPDLRQTHTLTTMNILHQLGHLTQKESDELRGAYVKLRGLENRIQLIADGHVHAVPEDAEDQKRLAALYTTKSLKTAGLKIPETRKTVHNLFNKFFADASPHTTDGITPASTSAPMANLSKRNSEILQSWQSGFVDYGISPELAPKLQILSSAMEQLVAEVADPNATIDALESFLRSLPPGGQYLRLLAENPALVRDILTPLSSGGAMARLLRHSPHVVDTLIQWQGNTHSNPHERTEHRMFVERQRDYESQLEAMRLYVNEMLYLAYLQAWRGEVSPQETRTLLTDLAREAMDATLKLVADEYGFAQTGLSVAAYGKFGMEEMMPESDLDIVFIAHGENQIDLEDVQTAHKFAARLKTALSTEMRGGRIYEIDTRLRPSGASGAPTVRLATFEDHQLNHAKTWEHLALVPAQFGAGPDFAKQAFGKVRIKTLCRPRDPEQLVQDAHSMLSQLRAHRIKPQKKGILELKLAPGGLMEAEYLMAYLVLLHANKHTDLANLPYCKLGPRLEKIDVSLKGLSASLRLLQDVHLYERLFGWSGKPINDLHLENHPIGMNVDVLSRRLSEAKECISWLLEAQLTSQSGLGPKKLAKHREEKVRWAD